MEGAAPACALWIRWDEAAVGVVDAFLAQHDRWPEASLVVCATDRASMQVAGQVLAESITAGHTAGTLPVLLTDGPPTPEDVAVGTHAFGPGLPSYAAARRVADPSQVASVLDDLQSRRRAVSATSGVVAVRFMGGLGNQLFQYALGRTVADRTGAPLVAERGWFGTQRQLSWELDDFRVRIDAFVDDERDWAPLGGRPARHVGEGDFRFHPELLDLDPGVLLEGYFQSPRYGELNVDALRPDLQPVRSPSSWAGEVSAQIAGLEHPTSVHVRRGDYVSNPDAHAVHGTCSPAYYRRALDHLDLALGGPGRADVVLFSDDPDWADENVLTPTARSRTVVRAPAGSPPSESLFLLGEVTHAVTANSSFSWWGARLRRRPGVTIGPRPWFTADHDTRDLLPPEWLTVDGR